MENGFKKHEKPSNRGFFSWFWEPQLRLTLFLGQRYVSKIRPRNFAWLDSVPTSNISRTIWSFVILCLQSWSLKLTVVSHHFLCFSVWKWRPKKNPHGYRYYKIEVLLKMTIFLGLQQKKMDQPSCWTSTVAPRRRDETWSAEISVDWSGFSFRSF